MSVYDDKYIKSKVKEFSRAVNTNVWGDKVRCAWHLYNLYKD